MAARQGENVLDFLGDLRRTHMCGKLRLSDAGKKVVLMGWVNRRRDLGQIIFVDLRDRTGITQVVFNYELNAAVHEKAEALRNEFVIAAIGKVKRRDADTINPNIPTGEVELVVEELRILNVSKPLPFLPSDTVLANEEMRLKYRYIDLRRDAMQFNIELRHKVALAIRDNLASQGFFEIETPFMTRSTPEGARDYLVPSRVQPGMFYALPQSPQLFKQILMISGFDKYFQIVRCFRDEDLRADRQPEFTQIDLEMSYPQPERVWEVVESFLTAAFKAAGHQIKTPFQRMDFDEAMRQYGIDKPDLRLPAFTDVADCFAPDELDQLGINKDLPVIAIRTPKVGELSRKERDDIKPLFVSKGGARVFEDFKRIETKFPEAAAKVREKVRANAGVADDDLLVLVVGSKQSIRDDHPAGKRKVTPAEMAIYASAGLLRVALAQKYSDRHKLFQKGDYRFLWVTNFPMFEYDEGEKRWMAAHHPFTSPHDEDMDKLETDPAMVRALAYDVVLNGTELGSGSIRIHRQDVQSRIFHALGMTEEEARSRFGFFLEALEYGTPPHGGIALGLDRIVMILAGADSLREVIPFPKTAAAKDLMMEAPTPVADGQLRELGIRVIGDRSGGRDVSKSQKRMPDVPTPDFVGAMCEIWSTISSAAYHFAYVKVYLQTRAMQTHVDDLRLDEQDVRNQGQTDVIICRSHLASFFWELHHVFEAIEAAINRGKKEHSDIQTFYGRERQLAAVLQSRTATDIEAYRNEGHNIPGIIGQRWQEKGGKFLYHFLPTLRENQSSEPAEMTQQLQAYFEFVANLWLAFVPEPYKSKFPRDFSFPVTVPFSYIGELPVELEGGVPQLQVQLEAFDRITPDLHPDASGTD